MESFLNEKVDDSWISKLNVEPEPIEDGITHYNPQIVEDKKTGKKSVVVGTGDNQMPTIVPTKGGKSGNKRKMNEKGKIIKAKASKKIDKVHSPMLWISICTVLVFFLVIYWIK